MKKVLIVDDEAIIRVTLRTLIDWEAFGLEVAADCSDGNRALEYMEKHPVDLLITDVKMPGMSGLELLRKRKEQGQIPPAVILSGYNEYPLVREAFRLGACDYLLKADLTAENLERLIGEIARKYWEADDNIQGNRAKKQEENGLRLPQEGMYGIVFFEVDEFQREAVRFQENLTDMLEKPMLELVNQIPKVKKRGTFYALQPGYYVFFYEIRELDTYQDEIMTLIRQMQAVWRDYMNLTVSAAVSNPVEAACIRQVMEESGQLMQLAPLGGRASISAWWEREKLLLLLEESRERYQRLTASLYEVNVPDFTQEKLLLQQRLDKLSLEAAKEEMLCIIALLALKFREYDDEFFRIFPEEINYYEKIRRLGSSRELELWMNNYFSWVLEYLRQKVDGIQTDMMLRAKRFMADNYSSSELTLKNVADYVGFNEKYFSTRFTRETGMTFRDYLSGLRISAAKRLLDTTDLKMYEIAERVGYNHVEHFNRMFKKQEGISPGDYKKLKN